MFSNNLIFNFNSNTYQDFSIFTTPFGKKEGCDRVTTKRDNTREAMSLSIPQLSPNKSIRSHGFSLNHKFNKGGIKNGRSRF